MAERGKRAYGTLTLVLLLTVMMCVEMFAGVARLHLLFNSLGLRAETWSWTEPSSYGRMLSYTVLHSNGQHFFWNALLILLVGTVVEQRVGSRWIVGLFVAGALIAAVSQLVIFPNETRPLVGASGIGSALFGAVVVIAGSDGFEIRLFPSSRWFALTLRRVLLAWVVIQIAALMMSYATPSAPVTVAYWAHLAGFAIGLLGGYAVRHLGSVEREPLAEPGLVSSFGAAGD
ncbi:MAG: rhomboid family intramembrane serine protease [Thermomicrobiales bacterium]